MQMKCPTINFEKQALAKGYKSIIGIDEAGRGSWAGPVVAAAVYFYPKIIRPTGITDSKLLTAAQRDQYYVWLKNNARFGVGIVSSRVVDRIGIVPATKRAMAQAVKKLKLKPDYLLIDAVKLPELAIDQLPLIKGDQKSWSIAAASIIAKVTRDRLMVKFHQQYPQYHFDRHKGYGTKLHMQSLSQYGVCPIHRLSYRPVAMYSQSH